MKIIDKKGRIFGKINFIDLFALIFLLSILIPMSYWGYRLFTNKPIKKPNKWQIKYEECVENNKQEEYNSLKTKVDNLLKRHKRLRRYFQ